MCARPRRSRDPTRCFVHCVGHGRPTGFIGYHCLALVGGAGLPGDRDAPSSRAAADHQGSGGSRATSWIACEWAKCSMNGDRGPVASSLVCRVRQIGRRSEQRQLGGCQPGPGPRFSREGWTARHHLRVCSNTTGAMAIAWRASHRVSPIRYTVLPRTACDEHYSRMARVSGLSVSWGRAFFFLDGRGKPGAPGCFGDPLLVARPDRQVLARTASARLPARAGRCRRMVALFSSTATGAYNIASGSAVTIRDVVRRLGELTGRRELLQIGALPARTSDAPLVLGDARAYTRMSVGSRRLTWNRACRDRRLVARRAERNCGDEGMKEFAVIGTGMAGFGAAHALYEAGIKPVMFDKHDYIGGHTASHEFAGGWTFDEGPHVSFTQDRTVQTLLANNIDGKFEVLPPASTITGRDTGSSIRRKSTFTDCPPIWSPRSCWSSSNSQKAESGPYAITRSG